MINALGLLKRRRFLPLFATQFLGAFNDNLFKTVDGPVRDLRDLHRRRGRKASSTRSPPGSSILPFFLLSALAGQLADTTDKARIIRIVKTAEIADHAGRRGRAAARAHRRGDAAGSG